MPSKTLLKEFARLVVRVGVNVQPHQYVLLESPVEQSALAHLIVKECYAAGADLVLVDWDDNAISRLTMKKSPLNVLKDIPDYLIAKYNFLLSKDLARIVILSEQTDLYKGISPNKIQKVWQEQGKKLSFFRNALMNDDFAWSLIAAPNKKWAKQVFPDLSPKKAVDALWDAILKTSRVVEGQDVVQEWTNHMNRLAKHNDILNSYNFKELHFKNSLGTDLVVGLATDHLWHGGRTFTKNGVEFCANIPTEESYTMPFKTNVHGKVVASKPLEYQGGLIEDFWLEFKDGKVINYDAKKNIQALKNLIEFDEGSCYIGEIALVPYHSPISELGILFYQTLFDENAACHMALGEAYPTTIKGGSKMSKEELEKRGHNQSDTHTDFMFGTKDLSIVGITYDGKQVTVFKDGDFAI